MGDMSAGLSRFAQEDSNSLVLRLRSSLFLARLGQDTRGIYLHFMTDVLENA